MTEPTHILIVDDDQAIRDLLTEGLSDSGYRCDTACDGIEGLRKVQTNGFAGAARAYIRVGSVSPIGDAVAFAII